MPSCGRPGFTSGFDLAFAGKAGVLPAFIFFEPARVTLDHLLFLIMSLIWGAIVYAEPLTWREMTGAAIMLLAAWIAIARKPIPEAPPA